ncbi:ATP-binding protein [Streptomyces sp. NPDC093568]|uniref:ATP-binding protein n=1 Tax=Streptomyces sp. NPDC093568 TaxID=3366041 RepID=UPI003827E4C2
MDCATCTPRRCWNLSFLADPAEVAVLRRALRGHLGVLGLHEVTDAAQLCVSELVSNVINHVGSGTPVTLCVSMRGTRLRLEVCDPDTRELPTLVEACTDAETGRGVALISATAERWGVQVLADCKVTWCELATGGTVSNPHHGDAHVSRAEQVLDLYREGQPCRTGEWGRLRAAVTERSVVDAIADLLHWLRVHGLDVDETLDRAQTHFEAETVVLSR